jgi:hypothetical protein
LFPNKRINRPEIADNLEAIYQTRNRIAHHEPVLGDRLMRVAKAIDFIVLNFGSKEPNEDAILARLELPRLRGLFTAWAGQVSS